MPRPTRGVPVELDRARHLRFSLGTVRQIREDIGAEALEEVRDEHLAKVLWYGLRHEDPDLTLEQVEDMIDLQNMPAVLDALTEATGGEGKTPAAPAADRSQRRSRAKKT